MFHAKITATFIFCYSFRPYFFFSLVTAVACLQGVEGYGPHVGEAVMRDPCSGGSQAVKNRFGSLQTDISRKSGKDLFCDYEICMK